MTNLVYFSSVSGNTHRFIEKLGREATRIPLFPGETPLHADEPFVLVDHCCRKEVVLLEFPGCIFLVHRGGDGVLGFVHHLFDLHRPLRRSRADRDNSGSSAGRGRWSRTLTTWP